MINGEFARVEAANAPFAATTRRADHRRRRWRGPVLVVGLVLLAALVIAVLGAAPRTGELDPEAASPDGARALAALLEAQGVRVETVTDLDAATASAGRTVLVALPAQLSTRQRDALAASRADLVLLRPDERTLTALAPGVRPEPVELPEPTEPACGLRAAVLAGPVDLAGAAYSTADPAAARCYPTGTPSVRCRWSRSGTAAARSPSSGTRRRSPTTSSTSAGTPPSRWTCSAPTPTCSGTCRCRPRPSPAQERGTSELLPPGWVWGPVQLLVAGLAARAVAGAAARARRHRAPAGGRPRRRDRAGPGPALPPRRGPRPRRGRPARRRAPRPSPGASASRAVPGTAPSSTRPPAAPAGRPGRWAPSCTVRPRRRRRAGALADELDRLGAAVRDASGATPGGPAPRA